MAVARHSYSTTGVKGNMLHHHVALMAPVRPGVLRGRRPVGGSGRLRGFIGGLHRPSTHSVPPGGHPRGNPGTCVFPRTLSGFAGLDITAIGFYSHFVIITFVSHASLQTYTLA